MTPIQQLMLGVGASEKTYLDDVFSTYLWTGSGSSRTITNNLNLSGDGGMTWIKNRTNSSREHVINDTVRGAGNNLMANSTAASQSDTNKLSAFASTGFGIGTDSYVNASTNKYASFSFLRSPGFFDIVTYTGTGSAKTVSHNLNSIPGCIMVKRTDGGSEDWVVYHRGMSDQLGNNPGHYFMYLNETNTYSAAQSRFNNVAATSTEFSVGTDNGTNGNGFSYVAYLFAGGESTAATARSVDFDGSDDYLSIPDSADFDLGNGDFTAEMWVRSTMNPTAGNFGLLGQWETGNKSWAVSWSRANQSMDGWTFKYSTDNSSETGIFGARLDDDLWHHIAVVRDSTYIKLYTDGILSATHTHSGATFYNSGATCRVGNESYSNSQYDGKISNVRLVKGTAVYTSAFRVPTKPLTNITNTKLLCCNDSSTTGSTVTPGTITAAGGPTASSDSPFDDPAGFKFGDSKEGVIKCGSYKGGGSAGFKVNIGWEPSWLMIKSISTAGDWYIVDSMRGVATGGTDEFLKANSHSAGDSSYNVIDFTSTGFQVNVTGSHWNSSTHTYSFIAIRRVDGYVGKPVEDATKVFAMDTGAGSSDIPNFDSTFPVDFAMAATPAANGQHRLTGARLMGAKYVQANTDSAEASHGGWTYDSNAGWGSQGDGSSWQSWMWKRHAGLDVVAYTGDGTSGRQIPHNLSKIPEMVWVKDRENTRDWTVYHSGLSSTSHYLKLNGTNAEANGGTAMWNNTAPTSTSVTLGSNADVNDNGQAYITMLFASVSGISSVGSYSGSDSSHTITTGFQPRFVIIKNMSHTTQWTMFDTVRGWTSGSQDYQLYLSHTNAHSTVSCGHPVSNGFYLDGDNSETSKAGNTFLYYAHA